MLPKVFLVKLQDPFSRERWRHWHLSAFDALKEADAARGSGFLAEVWPVRQKEKTSAQQTGRRHVPAHAEAVEEDEVDRADAVSANAHADGEAAASGHVEAPDSESATSGPREEGVGDEVG